MHGFEELALVADRPIVDWMLDFGFHLFVGMPGAPGDLLFV
jgi:hypothetical protein